MHRYCKLIFIDLETTGPNPATDFITEIGIVEVTRAGVERWSTLVNPQVPIPPFIQHLTGIDDDMVCSAPTFEMLQQELRQRLQDGLFIAHNARFDYGFLRNAFKRMGVHLRCPVLCTVKLSRKLFPQEQKHSLDALVTRHGLSPQARHRALADADLLWQFWRKLEASVAADAVRTAIDELLQHPGIPAQLEPELLDDVPDTPGVYMFYGEHDAPLYIGRGAQLRQRVLSHFPVGQASHRDALLAHQIRRMDWREAAGEVGAQLIEAQLLKDLRPAHNHMNEHEVCSWQLRGELPPALVYTSELDFGSGEHLYGLFNSRSKAEMALRALAEKHALCPAALGLEPGAGEPSALHAVRLENALAELKLKRWPYVGPIGLAETGADGRRDVHVVNNWCYLGTVRAGHDLWELWDILERSPARPAFDADTYKTVTRALALGKLQVQPLSAGKMAAPLRALRIAKKSLV